MRQRLLNASRAAQLQVRDGGVYGSTQGPRFETIAEVNRIERDGVDVIGMTAMPETILARELNLDYAALCIVANYAAGRGTSKHHIAADVITQTLQQGLTDISQLLINI
jgi:5'-methylthioadenosine phosphorylase